MAASMVARGQLDFGQDGGVLSKVGAAFLASLGLDLQPGSPAVSRRPPFCHPCLDWSERRPHIAGVVGREVYEVLLRKGWVRKPAEGRAVAVTPLGQRNLERHFGLAPIWAGNAPAGADDSI